jgi:hypothetical protein
MHRPLGSVMRCPRAAALLILLKEALTHIGGTGFGAGSGRILHRI